MPKTTRCYAGVYYYDFWIFMETTKAACGRVMEADLNRPSVTAKSLSKLVGEIHYDRARAVLWFKAKGAHHSVHPIHIPDEGWALIREKACPQKPYSHSAVSRQERFGGISPLPTLSSEDFDAKANATS